MLLEKIATKILKDQLGIMERGLVTRERDIERLEEIADARRSDLIELRARLDREIESLQQTAREQAKCIEQQTDTIRVLEKLNQESVDQESRLQVRITRLERDNMTIKDRLAKVKRFLDTPD